MLSAQTRVVCNAYIKPTQTIKWIFDQTKWIRAVSW